MRRPFPAKVMVDAFKRAKGHCQKCTARLYAGKIEYDHRIPDQMGGEPTLENCQVLCSSCHGTKTHKHDQPAIAKAKRRERKLVMGIKKASTWPKKYRRRSMARRCSDDTCICASRRSARELFSPGYTPMKEEMKELDVALPRDATVGDLLAALRKVEKWFGEFPDTGSKYADGTPLSYGYCYGSNGERDYMRRVARQAIVSYEEREAATRASTASSDIVPLLKRYDALTSDDDVVLVAIQVLRTAVAEIERLRARAALAEKA